MVVASPLFVSIWGLILLQRKNIKTKLDVIKIMELIKKATFFGASGKYILSLMKFPDEINLWSKFYY